MTKKPEKFLELNDLDQDNVEVFIRPTQFPDWAITNVIDPIEGSPNVLEPPDEDKQVGWRPRQVCPNNAMNWIHRLTNDWLKYLDQQVPSEPIDSNSKPLASLVGAGKIIYLHDLGEGGTMAFSDGTNWRKISDNSIITE